MISLHEKRLEAARAAFALGLPGALPPAGLERALRAALGASDAVLVAALGPQQAPANPSAGKEDLLWTR